MTEVMKMLINKIKEESLRIYLFTYATIFSTISISNLVDMFELPMKQVYVIISKMIINNEIMVFQFFINKMMNSYFFFRLQLTSRIRLL